MKRPFDYSFLLQLSEVCALRGYHCVRGFCLDVVVDVCECVLENVCGCLSMCMDGPLSEGADVN